MKYFAKVYVSSEADAENIVQDIFTELWEKREFLVTPIKITAYLFTATKNRCLNHLRQQTAIRETKNKIQEEYYLKMKASLHSLEVFEQNSFSHEDMEQILEQALDKLSDRCREIFIRSRIEGQKQKQIAEELNISVNTVETQMGIAYKKLRKELKDYLPFLVFLLPF